MIAVADYGAGNLGSVVKALRFVGVAPLVTHDAADLGRADALVVPGVGAFAHCMKGLRDHGLDVGVRRFIATGRPMLGICIGMQMLFGESEEGGRTPGLNVLSGRVKRFTVDATMGTDALKVPHMGWNLIVCRPDVPLFRGLPESPMVYFVHSYYAVPGDPEVVAAETDYGGRFCSAVRSGNVYGTQFHPEKSGSVGLEILRNFVALGS